MVYITDPLSPFPVSTAMLATTSSPPMIRQFTIDIQSVKLPHYSLKWTKDKKEHEIGIIVNKKLAGSIENFYRLSEWPD